MRTFRKAILCGMAQPMVDIVHPPTGGKATVPESVFAAKGGLKERGWILASDYTKRSTPKPKPRPAGGKK